MDFVTEPDRDPFILVSAKKQIGAFPKKLNYYFKALRFFFLSVKDLNLGTVSFNMLQLTLIILSIYQITFLLIACHTIMKNTHCNNPQPKVTYLKLLTLFDH